MSADTVDPVGLQALLSSNPVFAHLDDHTLALLAGAARLRRVAAGEVLLREGDPPDGAYLVVTGRLRVSYEGSDGLPVVLDELGRGELVGEMALLADQPRTATVAATRDSHVVFLSTDDFDRLVARHPRTQRMVSRVIVERMAHSVRRGPSPTPRRAVVVVPLDAHDGVERLADDLAVALEALVGEVPVVGCRQVEEQLGPEPTDLAASMWFDRVEAAHEMVLYLADADLTSWTRACLRRADLVLVVAMANARTAPRPVEAPLLDGARRDLPARVELVLVHPSTTREPRRTAEWLDLRAVDRHHHVRLGRREDCDRVARLLAGRAVGVVFSGGGARGIAHIGVLRTLIDRGVPIDATAGASIGAIVAGAAARGDDPDELARQLRAVVVDRSPLDPTVPFVSLAAGSRVTRALQDAARGLDVEDAWVDFRCVSTNLSRGVIEVHDRGPGWSAVRASFAIPGVFPPMRNDAGEVLVDGGILDNLPVAAMRAAHPGIMVIAVDVGARREQLQIDHDTAGVVSGWRHLARWLGRGRSGELMLLPRTLLRLTDLAARSDVDRGDLHLAPDLEGISLLDFGRFEEIADLGARHAADVLDDDAMEALGAGGPGAVG